MAENRTLQELSISDAGYAGTKLIARKSVGTTDAVALVMKDTAFTGNSTQLTTIELHCQRAEAHRLARYLLSL